MGFDVNENSKTLSYDSEIISEYAACDPGWANNLKGEGLGDGIWQLRMKVINEWLFRWKKTHRIFEKLT